MKTYLKENRKINLCINDVLKTLLYFDTFQYPLTLQEIEDFSQFSKEEIKVTLDVLLAKKIIVKLKKYYCIVSEKSCIERREIGNVKAKKVFKKAKKVSKFINQFPFVEAVFISGSLSKGYFGEDDDIDYFIITSPDRLWLARTLLILYKKVFLLNSKKYFCVNYFMSTNALEVKEKNRFTATEFVTLIPMSGNKIYEKLKNENTWILDYFPNYNYKKKSKPVQRKKTKQFLESLLKSKIGDVLEFFFMKITQKHQQKKFKKLEKKDFDIAFKGDKNTSKHHPNNHQVRVINLLNKKIITFNRIHQLNIPLEI